MKNYKSNSDKARYERNSEKKVEPVITGTAKTRKKRETHKFTDIFIAEDANNVKSYILMEVIIPTVKKTISDVITTGIEMLLYGDQVEVTKAPQDQRYHIVITMSVIPIIFVRITLATDAAVLTMMIFYLILVVMPRQYLML